MASTNKKIWFPAKRYGWGWGVPVAWQGWVVLLLFAIGIVAVATHVSPAQSPVAFAACIVVLVAAHTIVCWLKGEKPKWRWSKDE